MYCEQLRFTGLRTGIVLLRKCVRPVKIFTSAPDGTVYSYFLVFMVFVVVRHRIIFVDECYFWASCIVRCILTLNFT